MPSDKSNILTKKYSGVFSDGTSAAGYPSTISLTAQGLEFTTSQSDKIERWTFRSLDSTGPLQKTQPVYLFQKSQKQVRLYVNDPEFVDVLLTLAPHLSSRSEFKKIALPMIALGCVIIGLISLIWIFDIRLSRTIARHLPETVRDQIGKSVIDGIRGNRMECNATAGRAALDKILVRLKKGTGTNAEFNVTVINRPIINAFAAPGENIVILSKLITFAKTPESLAGVIAHEMGHGIELHPESGIIQTLGISAGIKLLLGGVPDTLSNFGVLLLQSKYSRDAEKEADTHAIRILEKAQIDPSSFASFFERLQELAKNRARKSDSKSKNKKGDDRSPLQSALDLLSTHPPSPERARRIREMGKWKSVPLLTDIDWQALKKICD